MKFLLSLAIFVFLGNAGVAATNASKETIGTTTHEILLNATSGSVNFDEDSFSIGLRAGYNYTYSPLVQFGIFPGFGFSHFKNNTGFSVGTDAGPTLNFSEDLQSSFYFRPTFGVKYYSNSRDTLFDVQGVFGKRFALSETLSYSPTFGAYKTLKEGTNVRFFVQLIAFSAFF